MSNEDKTVRYSNRDDNSNINIVNIEFSVEISTNRLDLRDVRLFVTK